MTSARKPAPSSTYFCMRFLSSSSAGGAAAASAIGSGARAGTGAVWSQLQYGQIRDHWSMVRSHRMQCFCSLIGRDCCNRHTVYGMTRSAPFCHTAIPSRVIVNACGARPFAMTELFDFVKRYSVPLLESYASHVEPRTSTRSTPVGNCDVRFE